MFKLNNWNRKNKDKRSNFLNESFDKRLKIFLVVWRSNFLRPPSEHLELFYRFLNFSILRTFSKGEEKRKGSFFFVIVFDEFFVLLKSVKVRRVPERSMFWFSVRQYFRRRLSSTLVRFWSEKTHVQFRTKIQRKSMKFRSVSLINQHEPINVNKWTAEWTKIQTKRMRNKEKSSSFRDFCQSVKLIRRVDKNNGWRIETT